MEEKTSAVIIGEFGITWQIDQSAKENTKEYQINLILYRLKKLPEENQITSFEDKLILIVLTNAKEIRESHLNKAS